MPRIGLLALQGNVALHCHALQQLGWGSREVRVPEELLGLEALIIPGGESSTLLKLMSPFRWQQAIKNFVAEGGVLFGTCAGAILLATVVTPQQESLGLIDITIERNAYGRQIDSFTAEGQPNGTSLGCEKMPLVFIRAPKIVAVGDQVEVLVRHDNNPVLVQQGRVLVATFHPELSADFRCHQRLLDCIDCCRQLA